MFSQGDRYSRVGQRTQPDLAQLLRALEVQAPPEVMARRRRALFELAEVMEPADPLWTSVGVPCPSTEDQFMRFVRLLSERSGMSIQRIASQTAHDATIETVPRSTVHNVLQRETLPKREDQLRALLVVLVKANGGTRVDLERLLDVRARLIAARTNGGSPNGVAMAVGMPDEFEVVGPARWQNRRDPLSWARDIGLLLMALVVTTLVVVFAFQKMF